MKIKCKKNSIYKAFQVLGGVSSSNTTKSILQNVKVEVKDEVIALFATDYEVGIKYLITKENYEEVEDGIVIIPENKCESILRDWTDEFVEIETKKNICNIFGENSKFSINGEADIENFPEEPHFSEDGNIEIDPFLLSKMIKKTIFVVISEKIKYTLSGILFKVEGTTLDMVATDGRRLSRVNVTISNPNDVSCNCIIPAKGLVQLERAISNDLKSIEENKLNIKVENNYIQFKTKNFILYAQLIDGKYPDFNKIIPSENKLDIPINSNKLLSAVKRASVVTTDGSKLVKFCFENNKLVLTADVSEIGRSTVSIDVDYDKEKFEIGFNPDFIVDVLNVVSNDLIIMKFTGQSKAGMVKEVFNENDDSFVHVIMPINLEEM